MQGYTIAAKKNRFIIFSCLLFFNFFSSCRKQNDEVIAQQPDSPNIILILADDVGYEVPTCNGGASYTTTTIDNLAAGGMRFTQCHACPNCSPSRVELLTGKYGFRNYARWGHLDENQKTIANLLQNAGYKTCMAGKWQLDGGDASIKHFGFDKYLVFEPFYTTTEEVENNYRYKNPRLYENAAYLPENITNGKYADDMFTDYISNFIDENSSNSFFVYYSLSLCHSPYSPTPDDPEFATWDPLKDGSDKIYFPSMIKYMDKIVQRIKDKIAEDSISNNTIIIFTGDNGTDPEIRSFFNGQLVKGGKATTTIYGTHVPLIAFWPQHISPGETATNLVSFADFFSAIADIGNVKPPSNYQPLDGVSFYPALNGSQSRLRDWIYCWWVKDNIWVQDEKYKLYNSSNNNYFFNIAEDPLEQNNISENNFTPYEVSRRKTFDSVLHAMHN